MSGDESGRDDGRASERTFVEKARAYVALALFGIAVSGLAGTLLFMPVLPFWRWTLYVAFSGVLIIGGAFIIPDGTEVDANGA